MNVIGEFFVKILEYKLIFMLHKIRGVSQTIILFDIFSINVNSSIFIYTFHFDHSASESRMFIWDILRCAPYVYVLTATEETQDFVI